MVVNGVDERRSADGSCGKSTPPPVWLEVVPKEGSLAVVTLPHGADGAASWTEASLLSDYFVTLQRLTGAVAVTVSAKLLTKLPPPAAATVEHSWVALRCARAAEHKGEKNGRGDHSETQSCLELVGSVGEVLDAAGIAWRTAAAGGSAETRLLLRRHDLAAAGAALAAAGHAVGCRGSAVLARLLAPPLPAGKDGSQLWGAGAWSLSRREDPLGTEPDVFEKADDGPVRLQARCGLVAQFAGQPPLDELVDVDLGDGYAASSSSSRSSRSWYSRAARMAAVSDGLGGNCCLESDLVSMGLPLFAGPLVRQHVGPLAGGGTAGSAAELLEVVGSLPSRHYEAWRRLGSADDKIVALELAADDKRKRAGVWLFCGRRFVRILGRPKGQGLVAGTCCRSLAQLSRHVGESAVEDEVVKYFEALEGEVESNGRLRARRDFHGKKKGQLIYAAGDRSIGGVAALVEENGTPKRLTLRLPGGTEERWDIREWGYDPFNCSSSNAQAAGAAALAAAAAAAAAAVAGVAGRRGALEEGSGFLFGSGGRKAERSRSRDAGKDKERSRSPRRQGTAIPPPPDAAATAAPPHLQAQTGPLTPGAIPVKRSSWDDGPLAAGTVPAAGGAVTMQQQAAAAMQQQ
eukprot:TRINITY_DN5632_c1_g2_i1.p1 TRINITY_DN5632_c1_g2~~TRINITY_DN5632_c1_g2_i1.p1  ORF type:complete len:632 (-),score=180.17 TRINITY_DN5632_c1_g2_i1:23-1918(-)